MDAMTNAERLAHAQLCRALRELRTETRALRCRSGDLHDAVADVVVGLERGEAVDLAALAFLRAIFRQPWEENARG
jgi:hypothetical protein